MKFGTIFYENEIYNLDYMSSEDAQEILNKKSKKELTDEKIIPEAILRFVYMYKLTQETICMKMNHQLNSFNVTIDRINPKFRLNSKNFQKIEDEIINTLSQYENILKIIGQKYDKKIEELIMKKVEIDSKLILELSSEEDDSIDNIKELQKQIKTLKRKITLLNEKKKNEILNCLEIGGTAISTQIRKPKTFSKITKFFSNRFNTYNVIMNKVIEPFNSRIKDYEANELKNKKIENTEEKFEVISEKMEKVKKSIQES